MITMDKFISNIKNLKNNSQSILRKEILDVFEPVVFQYVLYTRIDTGNARKAIGKNFGQIVNSARIIKATEYDSEVNHEVYNFWNFPNDDEWGSVCNILMGRGLLSVVIVGDDIGLYNQADNGYLPSENHETRLNNTPDRMPPNHIDLVNQVINMSDLENITNANISSQITNDIKMNVNNLIKKIELELWR